MIKPISKKVASAKVILMREELSDLIERLARMYGEDVICHENLNVLEVLANFDKRIQEMGKR